MTSILAFFSCILVFSNVCTSMSAGDGNNRGIQLRIAVPARSVCKQFVKVSRDDDQNVTFIAGFSIDVFEAAVKCLQYPLMYDLVPFYGSHTEIIKEVSNKNFDAAIGDILISTSRNLAVEFSQPYIESGLVMVVALKSDGWNQSWMLLRPFSKEMWFLMAAMTVFTGFVVWSLEHAINEEFRGQPNRQVGTSLWFAFSTVVFSHRERIRSQLSRLVLIPWLFLILIVTSTYTANLTSILTNPQLEPSKTDIDSLKSTNAAIGCDGNAFTIWYLEKVLNFDAKNIKIIVSVDEFAKSLSTGNIKAAFMFTPHASFFLSEYCRGFAMAGPTYKLNGFGFVFPRNSSLAFDISEAIIYLTQNGELQQLEKQKLSSSKCSKSPPDSSPGTQSLGPRPFAGLIIISGSVSIAGLIIGGIRTLTRQCERFTFIQTMLTGRGIWQWLATFFSPRKAKREIEFSTDCCIPETIISNPWNKEGTIPG